jgi:hypothetical protein
MYEIFFISYEESNADENWQQLKKLAPTARRIHGIKGLKLAHKRAAELSFTKMFYVVDGDAFVLDDFSFYRTVENYDSVYVWKSKNPVNDLEYGYGGVKLLPKDRVLNMDIYKVDMTTSLSKDFFIRPEVSNITNFNTDEFSTWRSAFRECAKLASRVIDRNYESETEDRLTAWCTKGADRPFGEYCIAGALAGKSYGEINIGNLSALSKINNFDWLKQQFASTILQEDSNERL